jgi:hypothetical protein
MDRREFMLLGAAGVGIAAGLAGCGHEAVAAVTRTAPAAPVLDATARAALNALGEALAPGAAKAGFADYLETQLAAAPEQAMLMLRYLGVPAPHADFYLPALAAAQAWSQQKFGKAIEALDATATAELVGDIAGGKPAPWAAAPAPFFYFVLRADAVDVAYGTRAGFERLGVPYMAHIEPAGDW